MKVFIDDKPFDCETSVGETATVEEAVREIQSVLDVRQRMVASLKCDGLEIPAQAMAATMRKGIADVDRLDIVTGTRHALVVDAMTEAYRCLADTEDACLRVAELLTRGDTAEATQTLGECLGIWQQIHEALAKSIAMLELTPEETLVDGQRLADVVGRPKEALLQVKQALQTQDYVLLADILQYEFVEVTQSWRSLIECVRQEAETLDA